MSIRTFTRRRNHEWAGFFAAGVAAPMYESEVLDLLGNPTEIRPPYAKRSGTRARRASGVESAVGPSATTQAAPLSRSSPVGTSTKERTLDALGLRGDLRLHASM